MSQSIRRDTSIALGVIAS